ncbi:hypothetical protein A0H81_11608 [Grifola frondosa]|uniref:Uncharacterized protein n=1 Tax=Grifola frondosa TaxID=5627 RepID=A0A1C7LW69_GRIFR|nr:hypothetical protein A0H81_11608 [Grifola frondosa]
MTTNGAAPSAGGNANGNTAARDIDPIWMSSRTARQIYALGEVEKVRVRVPFTHAYAQSRLQDISRLLSLAASSISLLTLPQTDGPDDNLPQGEERSEQFVLEVSEYFERLDVRVLLRLRGLWTRPKVYAQAIHIAMRSSLAHIRQSRIAPSAINAPAPGFIPPSMGVGLPSTNGSAGKGTRGLQEARVERDAWQGVLDALTRLKEQRDKENAERKEDEEAMRD